jgi:hypothetical protein
MTTYLGLWRRPDDEETFEAEYEAHLELAAQLPFARRMVAARAMDGTYYRVVSIEFDEPSDIEKAFASPVGLELRQQSAQMQEKFHTSVERVIYDETASANGSVPAS